MKRTFMFSQQKQMRTMDITERTMYEWAND